MSKVTEAVGKVRTALHEACSEMEPAEYLAVLEELAADIEGNIEAVKEENEELDS